MLDPEPALLPTARSRARTPRPAPRWSGSRRRPERKADPIGPTTTSGALRPDGIHARDTVRGQALRPVVDRGRQAILRPPASCLAKGRDRELRCSKSTIRTIMMRLGTPESGRTEYLRLAGRADGGASTASSTKRARMFVRTMKALRKTMSTSPTGDPLKPNVRAPMNAVVTGQDATMRCSAS